MRIFRVNNGAVMPRKYEIEALDEPVEDGASRGQILVMFAIFMIGLMGILGLATDVGFALSAKRSVQGAADSGALAGARMIARYTESEPTSAMDEINAVVAKNTFGSMTPTVLSCEYLKGMFDVINGVSCDQYIPSEAAGVRIKTRGTVKTWFIHVIPGAPKTVKVGGYAKARVQNVANPVSDAPFIVCGDNSWDVTSDPTGTTLNTGANLSILADANPLFDVFLDNPNDDQYGDGDVVVHAPMTINPAAVGHTFRIHDANLDKKGDADCRSEDGSFKGLADQSANADKPYDEWFNFLEADDAAGSILSTVDGAGGCIAGTSAPYNCVMILPIATSDPPRSPEAGELYVVGFAAFQVTQVNAMTHNATLLDDFITTGTGDNAWCRDCGGAVVVRLIW